MISSSRLFCAVMLTLMAQTDGHCDPGFNVVTFTKYQPTSTIPVLCAATSNEEVTSSSGVTKNECSNMCAFEQSCVGFNRKSTAPTGCDLFTTLPTTLYIDAACTYFEVYWDHLRALPMLRPYASLKA